MQGQTSSYVITTLITAPASYCLTTLANVKDELTIVDDNFNGTLTRYINEESANLAGSCNRVFGLATWQDEFRPQRGVWGEGVRAAVNPLKLSRWPVTAKTESFTGNTHSSQTVDGLSSTIGIYAGQLIFGPGIVIGTTVLSVNVAASSLQLSIAATAAATGVALNTGIQVIETKATNVTTLAAGVDFQIDQGTLMPGDEGMSSLYRLNEIGHSRTWPAGKITVVYQAGYALPGRPQQNQIASLPADLEGACLELITARFRSKGRDRMIRARDQPQVGRTEYWVGATPGQIGPYPNEIMSVINRYRTPVSASA